MLSEEVGNLQVPPLQHGRETKAQTRPQKPWSDVTTVQVKHPRAAFNPNVWGVTPFLHQILQARSSCQSLQLSGSEGVDPNVPEGLPPWSAHLSTISRTHSWGPSLAPIPSKVAEYYLSEASKCLPWCCSFMHPSSCSERFRSLKRRDRLQPGPRIKPSNSATHGKCLKKYISAGTYNCKASLSDLPNGFLMCVVIFAFKHWCEQMLSCLSRARLHIPPQPSLIMKDDNTLLPCWKFWLWFMWWKMFVHIYETLSCDPSFNWSMFSAL